MKATQAARATEVASRAISNSDSHRKRKINAVFQMAEGFALYAKGSDGSTHSVCPSFSVLGKIVDADGRNPGYLIRFSTLLGKSERIALPIAAMNSPDKIFRLLIDSGFEFPQENIKKRLTAFCMYLEHHCPQDVVYLRIERDGWITSPEGKLIYVYGERVYGQHSSKLKVYRTPSCGSLAKGTGKDWIALNRQFGNEPNAVLVACASLASVLLYPFGMDSILIFLIGSSGSGKTALLKYGCSFFDAPNSLLTWAGTRCSTSCMLQWMCTASTSVAYLCTISMLKSSPFLASG